MSVGMPTRVSGFPLKLECVLHYQPVIYAIDQERGARVFDSWIVGWAMHHILRHWRTKDFRRIRSAPHRQ